MNIINGLKDELNLIIKEINKKNLHIKFYGAIGVKFYSRFHSRGTFDIDLFALSEQQKDLIEIFKSMGYQISRTKRRSDLVFFKKEPFKIKIDVELNRFKTFDNEFEINLIDYIKKDGVVLPPFLLLITKLFADLNDDNVYDLAHLISEGNPEIDKLKDFLGKLGVKQKIILQKISNLPEKILKNKRIEKDIKNKSLRILKNIKRSLNLK
ncbi:MAG: hypothetical protein ACTSRP_22370 [Candidatus Helarchaeota archaeon]